MRKDKSKDQRNKAGTRIRIRIGTEDGCRNSSWKRHGTSILLAMLLLVAVAESARSLDDVGSMANRPASQRQHRHRTAAQIIRVPHDAPTIQAGIDAAVDGDTVLVADGTYSGPGNREIQFHGKAITVRSENGPYRCIVDLGGTHRGFLFLAGEPTSSILRGFTIRNGYGSISGAAVLCMNSSPWIVGNRFEENACDGDGAAIYCYRANPLITDNFFHGNEAGLWGGAVGCQLESRPTLDRNIFRNNEAQYGGALGSRSRAEVLVIHADFLGNTGHRGGAVDAADDQSVIRLYHCRFKDNSATWGGAVSVFEGARLEVTNGLMTHNTASDLGGGISVGSGTLYLDLCTVAFNEAASAGGGLLDAGGVSEINNSILWGNTAPNGQTMWLISATPAISWSCVEGGWPGTGNIADDPLFTGGPRGDHYLSHQATGQPADSPCVDAADPDAINPKTTTRADHESDWNLMDMGFHEALGRLVTGPGPGPGNPPRVRVMPPAEPAGFTYQFNAYGSPHFGVNVACGEFITAHGYGMDEIITGAGPGAMYGPHVRGFYADGTPVPGLSFLAYGTNKFGVNVATGDLMFNPGPGSTDEIITGAGPGAVFGPHVRAFFYNEASASISPVPGVSFFAYGTNKFGVNVAAGDIDGDGYDEIVTGPGPGAVFGPHVRGWDVSGGAVAPIAAVSFMAYGTNKFGVRVTCGDVDRDGIDEIITAPGPGVLFGTHIRGWNHDGHGLRPMADLSFFAWPPGTARYGASVFAGADINGDWQDDIVVGCGPDPDAATPLKVFHYGGREEGMVELLSFDNCYPTQWTHGTRVAAGRL